MELGKQIKMHRQKAQFSQEELANRVYVSRQTISNWENDKSYPDVNSLVLLSEIFQISLDKLIKGDIDVMKEAIKKEEVKKMKQYGTIYTILLVVTVVSALPLFMWLGTWAFIPWGIIWAISMCFALKVEKLKKDNDIQTYKEIVAFTEQRSLSKDEIIEEKANVKVDVLEKAKADYEAYCSSMNVASGTSNSIYSSITGAIDWTYEERSEN